MAGSTLSTSLLVRVSDNCLVPFAGVAVKFTASAGTLSVTEGVTDASGNLTTKLTLPDVVGAVTVVASATGYTSVTFTETATAPVVVP